jgi:hypothetical protein
MTMKLYKANGSWIVRDDSAETKRLFGTNDLATPFTDRANASDVVARIQKLNPTATVSLL